jgi:hypothetical protein
MLPAVKSHVRYWGFLLLKLMGAALGSSTALWFLNLFWYPATPLFHLNKFWFGWSLLYTTLAGVWFLFSYGLFYLAFWDQRYRCRTCLRRLVMPIETGSWGYMLQLGRPQIEYICPYGHGKLNVEELQISGKVQPEWTKHGDIWDELFAISDRERDER